MRGSRWLSALPTGSKWVQAQPARPTGSAGMSFSENSGKPKKLGTLIYGPQFRVLPGGSQWVSALPTGSKWSRALPGRKGCGPLELSRGFDKLNVPFFPVRIVLRLR